jgi:hypothetical protein
VNSVKLYIETLVGEEKPVGNADNEVLIYAPSYHARKATVTDIPFLINFVGFSVYVTPATMPESTFWGVVTA